MPTLTAQVSEEFVEEVDAVASELDRPRAWVIKSALREYVGRHRLVAERWRETEEAIAAAERGEVLPGEDVLAWLDTWGKEAEKVG